MVERNLEKEFKDAENPFRLAIVCAMWITGFDAQCVSTVYLDKPIKGHTLMQTIARANRVYDDEKENGLIVDYGNVYKQLEQAYSIYGEGGKGSQGTGSGKAVEEIADLEKEFSGTNIQIAEGDILDFDIRNYLGFGISDLEFPNYKIIGNLPYYITSHFIRTVFEEWPQPSLMILMVQKEVAKRIVARPPEMNLLALSVQYYAKPEIITYVSRGSFRPAPTVDSAVIKLTPRAEYFLIAEKEELFFSILKSAFGGKRKQLINTLPTIISKNKQGTAELLTQIGISPQTRPETVDLAHWLILVNSL